MKKAVFIKLAAFIVAACIIMSSCGLIKNNGTETSAPEQSVTETAVPAGTTAPGDETTAEPYVDPAADIAFALGSSSVSRSLYEGYLRMTWATACSMFTMFGIISEDDLVDGKTAGELRIPEDAAEIAQILGIEPDGTVFDFVRDTVENAMKQILVCAEAANREGIAVNEDKLAEELAEADAEAKANGYESYLELVKIMFGGISDEDAEAFIELSYLAEQYKSMLEDHVFTEDEITAFINDDENSYYFEAPVYTVLRGEHATELREKLSEPYEDEWSLIEEFIDSLNGEGITTERRPDFTDPELVSLLGMNIPGSYAFGTENGEDCYVYVNAEREIRDSRMLTYYLIISDAEPADIVDDLKKLSVEEAEEYIKAIIEASESDTDVDFGEDDDDNGADTETADENTGEVASETPEEGGTPDTGDGETPDVVEGEESGEEEEPTENVVTATYVMGQPDWRNPEFAGWLTAEGRAPGDVCVKKSGSQYLVAYVIDISESCASADMISDYVNDEISRLVEESDFISGDGIEEIDIPAKPDEILYELMGMGE
ncbi:MAG: hypothetical protein IKX86_02545 [Clostridia bacterium]|nr:hypothetical protein [Clostridia bacterium]